MTLEVTVPEMGEGIEEVAISRWHFRAGDKIEEGQDLVEVATDKATFNVTSPGDGVLTEIYFQEGDQVEVGEIIALIEKKDEEEEDEDEDEEEI